MSTICELWNESRKFLADHSSIWNGFLDYVWAWAIERLAILQIRMIRFLFFVFANCRVVRVGNLVRSQFATCSSVDVVQDFSCMEFIYKKLPNFARVLPVQCSQLLDLITLSLALFIE